MDHPRGAADPFLPALSPRQRPDGRVAGWSASARLLSIDAAGFRVRLRRSPGWPTLDAAMLSAWCPQGVSQFPWRRRIREAVADAAKRELLEETGFESSLWRSLGSFITNANQGGATAHFFRASACRRVAEPRSGDLEDSEVLLMRRSEVLAVMQKGGLASLSHVALLAIATHPAMASRK
jgi:8-oxo-dGTP pyrophosphatase MutT (NUDIX family)